MPTAAKKKAQVAATAGEKPVVQSRAVEDYLEQIHNLIRDKGYARVVDIAANLEVSQASVTNMVQRLAVEGYLVYERYRGVTLTSEGLRVGAAISHRHEVLTRLLSSFGLDAVQVHRDVEGMEHHISRQTLNVLTVLLAELDGNPELMANGRLPWPRVR
jgi:Mn-dependent DtxR family transcriptional regulator